MIIHSDGYKITYEIKNQVRGVMAKIKKSVVSQQIFIQKALSQEQKVGGE